MILKTRIMFLRVILIYYSINGVMNGHLSPIYLNHYFVRQFLTYINESNISNECKTSVNYMERHANEEWALKCMICYIQ